jgi:hypothetical protein
MAGGRPTDYDPNYHPKSVLDYIEMCQDVDIQRTQSEADGEKGWSKSYQLMQRVNLPTVEGYALHEKIARSAIYRWIDDYPEFKDTIDILLNAQKQRLVNSGLSGHYNPTITKLMLCTNHGMSDKQQTEHSGGVTVTIPSEFAGVIRTDS